MSRLTLGGFIRGLQEARDALAEVLALPERRFQIILIMQKIVICMSRDTRRFLSDAMAGLVEGGLEYMRQRRREALQAHQRKAGPLEAPKPAAPEKKPAGFKRTSSADIAERIRREVARKREEEEAKRQEAAAFESIEVVESEADTVEIELPPPPTGAAAEVAEIDMELPPPPEAAPVEAVEEEIAELPPPPPAPPEPAPEPEPAPAPEPEPVAVAAEPDEIKAIEELGTELDALSLAHVAREIFPDLDPLFAPWRIGRAIYLDEAAVRKALIQGARLKANERATMLAPAFDDLKRIIEAREPAWIASESRLRAAVDAEFSKTPPLPGRSTPDQVFEVIAMADDKARRVLKSEPDAAAGVVNEVRRRLDRLLEIEAEQA